MSITLLRRGGPLLALALVLAAACASLSGPGPVQNIAGSWWFIVVAVGLGALAALTVVLAAIRRSWVTASTHLGLVVALAGIGANQTVPRSGYVFLESGGSERNFILRRNLRSIDELPVALSLESLGRRETRAFAPAPVAWLGVSAGSRRMTAGVTYNRPLTLAGRCIMLSSQVEPGFPIEYEISADGVEYVLLHNQRTETESGRTFWSFGYDTDNGKLGILVGGQHRWLGIGETASVENTTLQLQSVSFASAPGVILAINDIRLRWLIYAGLALALFGVLAALVRREQP